MTEGVTSGLGRKLRHNYNGGACNGNPLAALGRRPDVLIWRDSLSSMKFRRDSAKRT